MQTLANEALTELTTNILPYWMHNMTDPCGGFYGRRDGRGVLDLDAPKGLILNARILWSFSAAARVLGDQAYLETARRAAGEVMDKFCDAEYGGAYWSLDAAGRPLDTKKQFYAIAFAIYGLAEYYRAAGERKALDCAIELYRCIDKYSRDAGRGGYLEACARDWSPLADMRLSDKDQNDAKTMNTHLHILEGYTNLYRVWPDKPLGERLREMIGLFLDRIVGDDGHLRLFFDEEWHQHGDIRSYGHDIECSWLLWEAALVLGDESVIGRCREACPRIARAAMEGFTPGAGMICEWNLTSGVRHADHDWWVQAETVVGCVNQYQMTGEARWLEAAHDAWAFIKEHLIASDGEWIWSLRADGTPNLEDDRAGFWKCPYHNSRMCLELLARV